MDYGYANNTDGDAVEMWAENCHLNLIHNAKQPKSFNSGRCTAGYSPDIAFVSHKITGLSKKLVLEPLPRTQHRPISITVNPAITTATVPFQRRFDFGNANWPGFQEDLDRKIAHLPADPRNHDKFTKLVHKAASKNIPRGCHTQYILGFDATSTKLLEQYQQLY